MKRSEFKNLIKECIRELASEGVFASQTPVVQEARQQPAFARSTGPITESARDQLRRQADPEYMGSPSVSYKTKGEVHPEMQKLINSVIGGNERQSSMLQEIFADTAMTTLVEQREELVGENASMNQFIPQLSENQKRLMEEEENAMSKILPKNRWAALAGIGKQTR